MSRRAASSRSAATRSRAAREYEVLDADRVRGHARLRAVARAHLPDALARGRADDLALLDWLRRFVWPYEAALGISEDVAAAARLALCELVRGGTTTIQDMGTVHHTDSIFERRASASGIRATIGMRAMMDDGSTVPAGLRESTRASVDESVALCQTWHGEAGGRLRYAFAPRFVLSCTEALLRETAEHAPPHAGRADPHARQREPRRVRGGAQGARRRQRPVPGQGRA